MEIFFVQSFQTLLVIHTDIWWRERERGGGMRRKGERESQRERVSGRVRVREKERDSGGR